MTERELQEILRNNPDVKAPGFEQREPLTPAAKQWLAEERKKLEERFLAWWQAIGGPELEREYAFAPGRRFRADFAHLESKVLIEIDGAYYRQGGGSHNSAGKAQYELERNKIAWSLGWEVKRLPTGFRLQDVEAVLDVVVERMG